MSFSAVKDITLSNERTTYNHATTGSLFDNFKNENAAGMHKLSTVYYTDKADTSVYDHSDEDNSASANATSENGYIAPYEVTTTESNEYITDNKKSGFLKYEPDVAIEGNANATYFWVEDFKNWCTWKVNDNTLYVNKPAVNSYTLCFWNGKNGFEPLTDEGLLNLTSDESVNSWQNDILNKLRRSTLTDSITVDNFINQYRGDFKDKGFMPYGDKVPGMQACTYILRKTIDYSINDSDSFQTFRYGNPMNIDLAQPASTSTYLRKILNIYLDEGAVKRIWGDSLESAEKRIWDHTHYNENSDTGGEETSDYVSSILLSLYVSPVAGAISYLLSSKKGNGNMMYHYRSGSHKMCRPKCEDKVFFDPNYGDTVSWCDLETRYFSSYYDYGMPLQPYVTEMDKSPCSDFIVLEFKSSSYKGKYQQIYFRNGHLKWQNSSSNKNPGAYSFGIQGESPLRFGLCAGAEEIETDSRIKDGFSDGRKIYKNQLGYWEHATNVDFMNLASVGLPPLYRLPSGELGINVRMRIGGPRGLTGYDADFLNKKCQKIFGNGQDKTIDDNWLKDEIINSYEESTSSIKDADAASLDSTKQSQTNNIVNNEMSLTFGANNLTLSTSDIASNDYAAKW